jgi:hypothetical protein
VVQLRDGLLLRLQLLRLEGERALQLAQGRHVQVRKSGIKQKRFFFLFARKRSLFLGRFQSDILSPVTRTF